jgi:hypothetical protein
MFFIQDLKKAVQRVVGSQSKIEVRPGKLTMSGNQNGKVEAWLQELGF